MKAKLSVEITEDKSGKLRCECCIDASKRVLPLVWLVLAKAMAKRMGLSLPELAAVMMVSGPLLEKYTEFEAAVDMGAIKRAQEKGKT